MEEVLDLEPIWGIIKRMYGKKKDGWEAAFRMTDSKLFDFFIKGPDVLAEIVQDSPYAPMDSMHLPRPWKPLGRGAILDEDPAKFNIDLIRPYGLRPVPKKIFKKSMEIIEMIQMGLPAEVIMKHYQKLTEEHVKSPVVNYGEITTPIATVGPFNYRPDLSDISESQRKLRSRMENEIRRMQRRSYIA